MKRSLKRFFFQSPILLFVALLLNFYNPTPVEAACTGSSSRSWYTYTCAATIPYCRSTYHSGTFSCSVGGSGYPGECGYCYKTGQTCISRGPSDCTISDIGSGWPCKSDEESGTSSCNSGATASPTPTGSGNNCGTQNCTSSEVCCFTGCYPITEGCPSGSTPVPTATPTPTPVPGSGYYFDLRGDGGYPGVPAYGGGTSLTTSNVSETGWLANSGYNASKIYNYTYFVNAIPDGTTINTLPGPVINGTSLSTGGTASDGIYWYEYDPASFSGSDLTINGVTNLGARKVILLVKGADVNLNGQINLTKGSGFFLLAVGKTATGTKGNIIVNPSIGGGAAANLEGVFVTDGEFRTGTVTISSPGTFDNKLWVRGSIATYGGMSLQRDLGPLNTTTPAEFFEFAPDLAILFPAKLGIRPMSWEEVAP